MWGSGRLEARGGGVSLGLWLTLGTGHPLVCVPNPTSLPLPALKLGGLSPGTGPQQPRRLVSRADSCHLQGPPGNPPAPVAWVLRRGWRPGHSAVL